MTDRVIPEWEPAPLPGGTPPTPGGSSSNAGGTVGLTTRALVGPAHRIPILYGRCLISPDLAMAKQASRSGMRYGTFLAVISEGPIDAIESWQGATTNDFQTYEATLGVLTTPSTNLFGMIGLAGAFFEMKNSRPWSPACIAQGRKLFDPRLGAWGAGEYPDPTKCAYSTNLALAFADLRTFPQYGDLLPAQVDWQSVEDAADWCDEIVDGAKRYELNLWLTHGDSGESWLETLGLHGGLRWREEGGLWKLDFSQPVATVSATITDDHVFQDSTPTASFGGGAGLADRPNRFRAEWIDPASGWKVRTVELRHPEVEAGAPIRDAAVYKLHGFHSEAMALRALWRIAHEIWSEQTLELELSTEMLHLQEGSRVTIDLPCLGISGDDYLVTKLVYDGDRILAALQRYDTTTWTSPGSSGGALPDDGFFDTPPALTSVARSGSDSEVTAVTPTSKTTVTYLGFSWQLPVFSWPGNVVIRVWAHGTGATWDTAGYTEFVVPANGDPAFAADPTWKAFCRPIAYDTTVRTYGPLGDQVNEASTGAGFEAILKLRSLAGVDSTGVSVSEAAHSSSTPTPSDQEPVLMEAGLVIGDGQIPIWDSVTGEVTFPGALAVTAPGSSATIGGRLLIGVTVLLAADVAAGATSIQVNRNTLVSGDRIMLEGAPGGVAQTEFMAITSAPSGAGPYTYSVTRDLDGSGANAWKRGDAVFSTGQTGAAFIDVYSLRGVKSSGEVGPAIVGNVRNSATWNDWTPRWAVGNLKGLYGYAADTYGAAFGVPSGPWLKIDPTNGIRIGHNATTKVQIDSSGAATFSGTITATGGSIGGLTITASKVYDGVGTWGNANTPFYIGSDGSFSLGAKITWDGANLYIHAGDVTIDESGIRIPAGGVDDEASYGFTVSGVHKGGLYGLSDGGIYVGRASGGGVEFKSNRSVFVGWLEADGYSTRINTNPGSGYFDADSGYKVLGARVVGSRGAAVADATNATDVITQLNALLARLRAHGLIYS